MGAWVGWLLFVNFFRLWMIPFGLAIGVLVGSKKEDEEEKKKEEKKEKKHSKMKDLKFIANSKEAIRSTQENLEWIAELLERAKHTFEWTIPFSAIVLIVVLL